MITMNYYHRVDPNLLFPWILPTSKDMTTPYDLYKSLQHKARKYDDNWTYSPEWYHNLGLWSDVFKNYAAIRMANTDNYKQDKEDWGLRTF